MNDDLLPAERKVVEALRDRSLDFRAMWAISNLFRAAASVRRHMEASVLATERVSWTSFVALWVLWVWGELGANAFADAIGISRPTATGVLRTLDARGWISRRPDPSDGRSVLVSLTAEGRSTIEHLFPRFNAEETAIAGALNERDQDRLASMLRSLTRSVQDRNGSLDPPN
ncbi:MAG TPA: MarR family transcriptional regulator [Actinomycetota bacterium]|nr:MarR family transcriptional regulator [Actinomycetota bacterium]